MKIIVILLLSAITTFTGKAQTFQEIFNQKKTQKKYLLQQIAALQIYIDYAQKGYKIANQGIDAIGDLSKGELNLHSAYFSSLKSVNPAIKNYAMVADIISLQLQVVKIYKSLFPVLNKAAVFDPREMKYISQVFDSLMDDCASLTDDLIDVTTGGKLELTDDQRLARIDALYKDMQGKYSFSRDFSNQTLMLARAKSQGKNDVSVVNNLYGIKF